MFILFWSLCVYQGRSLSSSATVVQRLSHQLHIAGFFQDSSIYLEYMWLVNLQQDPLNKKSYSNKNVIVAIAYLY